MLEMMFPMVAWLKHCLANPKSYHINMLPTSVKTKKDSQYWYENVSLVALEIFGYLELVVQEHGHDPINLPSIKHCALYDLPK